MAVNTLFLTEPLYRYMLDISLQEPEVASRLRLATSKLPQSKMQIAPEQGQFLAFLIRLMNAKKTIDLGVFTGYSALSVALALPEDGKLYACDISHDFAELASDYWQKAGVRHKIDLHIKDAADFLQQLISEMLQQSFDFIFFDINKEAEINLYEDALTLLRPGGMMAFDNVFKGGKVCDDKMQTPSTIAKRKLNLMLLNDNRIIITTLPIGDGLTLLYKK